MKLRKYSVQLKSFLFFVSIILQSQNLIFAQDSLSCLFIGNSYVQYNNLPNLVASIATSKGKTLTIGTKANGGFTFQSHVNDAATYTSIYSKSWDYVVLQGQSQEPSFPYGQVNTQTLPPAVQLADSVYANWYCSQALYFMTWGRQNGDPQWDSINTFDKMNSRLRDAYVRIADSAQASIAPVGVAWKWIRDNYPLINLYSGDGSHPSAEGSYLAACTFYASLFRLPSAGAAPLLGIDALTAQRLQEAADLAVLDSLSTWHLRPVSELSIADFSSTINQTTVQFVNESWRSTDYLWDFGDGTTSIEEHPLHTYSNPNTFIVTLTASSVCSDDVFSDTLVLPGAGISNLASDLVVVADLGQNVFGVHATSGSPVKVLNIIDINGKEVLDQSAIQAKDEYRVDLSKMSIGSYFLLLSVDEQLVRYRVQVN
jgi:hypothetical protein